MLAKRPRPYPADLKSALRNEIFWNRAEARNGSNTVYRGLGPCNCYSVLKIFVSLEKAGHPSQPLSLRLNLKYLYRNISATLLVVEAISALTPCLRRSLCCPSLRQKYLALLPLLSHWPSRWCLPRQRRSTGGTQLGNVSTVQPPDHAAAGL
jgi:hypothetical protein